MARIWSSGFELNSVGTGVEWDNVSGGTIVTSPVRSGTYAYKPTPLTSGSRKALRYLIRALDGNGPFYFRTYFNVDTLPTAENGIILLRQTTGAGSDRAYVTIDDVGALRLYDEDGVIGSASSALSLNTWHRIEIKWDRTGAAGSHVVRAQLDGTEFAAATNRDISTGIADFVVGCNCLNEVQTTGTWYFDDCAVNNELGGFLTSYPGDTKIIHLTPNAAGDASAWTNDYTYVDEITPDDATTLVSSNTLNEEDLHNLSASGIGASDTVNLVAVGARFNGAGASANAGFKLEIEASAGGTIEQSAEITPTNTTWRTNASAVPWNHPLILYDLPGASTTAWTQADLDSAQIGYKLTTTSTNAAQISTLWALVDYVPVAAAIGYRNLLGVGI